MGAEAPRDIATAALRGAPPPPPPPPLPPLPSPAHLTFEVAQRRATRADGAAAAYLHELRPLNTPSPLRVQLDDNGRVVALWRTGRLTPRRITAIQDRWRIDDEWWRERAVSRMYYALLLDDGTLLTIYHDLITDEWFEQRS